MFEPPSEPPEYHYIDPKTGKQLDSLPEEYDTSDEERQ